MTTAAREINITVVCPQPDMLNVLNKIRRWHLDDPLGNSSVRHVAGTKGFKEALLSARQCPEQSILVPLGYRKSDVVDRLNDELLRKLEIIIRPPRPGLKPEIDELPNASLLEDRHIVNVQDPLPALRKSLLRLRFRDRIRVRELESEDDFRQYFSLRYRVWKPMGYLPVEQDCPTSQWELNFTDRAAYPLGVFTREGTLIACARLVFPLGQDSHHLRLIHKLVAATGDPKLAENLESPKGLRQLLDLLDSFRGFHEYFKRLIRSNIRAAEVSRVIVTPEHREKGLGEVLVDSLVSLARQRQLQMLFLACHLQHKGFYERSGFYVLPGLECERFAGVNAPAIAMARKLTVPGEFTLQLHKYPRGSSGKGVEHRVLVIGWGCTGHHRW